jgi:hypothetical protein
MVVTNCGSTKKGWEVQYLCGFQKVECNNQKDFFPLPFIDEVANTMARCEAYSFLDGYFGYHHISVAQKDTYTTFVTN